MELAERYLDLEIAREEFWKDDPPVLVWRPATETFRADDAWFRHILGQMREVRQPGTYRYVFPSKKPRPHDGQIDIDVGLIDVKIDYHAATKRPDGSLDMDEVHRLYGDNQRRFHRICGGQLHTQMVIATAIHQHRADGSFLLHFHNLIFSIRKQVEPDEHIGVIDLLPLVHTFGKGRTLGIVEDVWPAEHPADLLFAE